uniref:poly-beta-1,6-N-acetyl-D-glucosamine biosynthesis protein PgaD n=1 Tax=Castellaniella defragrans TaxID=75697 RepID=UPI00333E4951
MIISTGRSAAGFLLDMFLTVLGWAGLVYLLFGGWAVAIMQGSDHDSRESVWSIFLPTAGTLTIYALIAAASAAILIIWSSYNHWRFAGLDRRKPMTPIGATELAASFSLAPDDVMDLNAMKAATIHHDENGMVISILSGN